MDKDFVHAFASIKLNLKLTSRPMAAAPVAMTIIYHKEDFLFTLFPELASGDNELIISTLTAYYSYGNNHPTISIVGDIITI